VNQRRYLLILITSSSDRCYLQKRVLNSSKGPAVRALRAQTDKKEYAIEMKHIVERLVYGKQLWS
jgi:tRNA U34 5-carboxymethylaminomethyl modifying enzyme MnmG/GidA